MAEVEIGKYLRFYIDCMQCNSMPKDGLCNSLADDLLVLFEPTEQDAMELTEEGKSVVYWGSGCTKENPQRWYKFSTLRQTIVLFMAAINNEL
jgi:hypothetical protein